MSAALIFSTDAGLMRARPAALEGRDDNSLDCNTFDVIGRSQ
jgi:hypothetical protein